MPDPTIKTIVLTGCTRGLGRAMAEAFIERGHIVHGCGRSVAAIGELTDRYGRPHSFNAVDVADSDSVRRWAESVLAGCDQGIDLLINNAGVINASAPLWEVGAAEFSRVIGVNVKGVANVIRAFAPAMIERCRGVVVNFSSGWGRSTSPEVAPYCASKWAIEGLSSALAQELPRGMASVALNPGIIDTDMLRSCFGDSAAHYARPQEWARAAVPFILQLSAADNGGSLSTPGC